MALSYDDQLKCVIIWKFFSEKDTRPEQWNEKAADQLAAMVVEANNCSTSMDLVPRPAGSRPGWFWLLNQAFGALKRYITSDRSLIYDIGSVKNLSHFLI